MWLPFAACRQCMLGRQWQVAIHQGRLLSGAACSKAKKLPPCKQDWKAGFGRLPLARSKSLSGAAMLRS